MTLREATAALYAATCAVQDAVNENDHEATWDALHAVRMCRNAVVDALVVAERRVPA